MPELPEVEVLRRDLEGILLGESIERWTVRETRLRERVDRESLQNLCEREILKVERRGKYLLWHFRGDFSLLTHLGMSGQWRLDLPSIPYEPHDHLILLLENGKSLRYRDPRRFGLVIAGSRSWILESKWLAKLGLEPFDPQFDGLYLQQRWRGLNGPVKNALMKAETVVGVGNIYASEALFGAGIHPQRSAGRIGLSRLDELVAEVRRILVGAIERGGTTLRDYANAWGEEGQNQSELRVYGREGQPCLRCNRVLRKIVQAGRSTFYCPGCQR